MLHIYKVLLARGPPKRGLWGAGTPLGGRKAVHAAGARLHRQVGNLDTAPPPCCIFLYGDKPRGPHCLQSAEGAPGNTLEKSLRCGGWHGVRGGHRKLARTLRTPASWPVRHSGEAEEAACTFNCTSCTPLLHPSLPCYTPVAAATFMMLCVYRKMHSCSLAAVASSLERLPTRGKLACSFPSPDVASLTASSPLPCPPPSGDAAAAEGGADELAAPLPPAMTDDVQCCRRHVQLRIPQSHVPLNVETMRRSRNVWSLSNLK